jgi:hypothetical protein
MVAVPMLEVAVVQAAAEALQLLIKAVAQHLAVAVELPAKEITVV